MSGSIDEAKVESYMLAAAWMLSDAREEVNEVLAQIDKKVTPRSTALEIMLLAVRRYLRVGGKRLDANWSWSDAEVKTNAQIEPTKTLYAEAAKVQANFRKANVGYHLILSPVRSVEKQVHLWCTNPTVKTASKRLMQDMGKELQKPDYPDVSGGAAAVKFMNALKSAVVHPEPTSAAPGTSGHGRGTAVDFIIMRGSKAIATTSSSQVRTVWDQGGWSAKLQAAASGTRLKGPLRAPYEPWHWSL